MVAGSIKCVLYEKHLDGAQHLGSTDLVLTVVFKLVIILAVAKEHRIMKKEPNPSFRTDSCGKRKWYGDKSLVL